MSGPLLTFFLAPWTNPLQVHHPHTLRPNVPWNPMDSGGSHPSRRAGSQPASHVTSLQQGAQWSH